MVNLDRVSNQIKNDGLFSYIYDEMCQEANLKELNEDQIKEYLLKEPKHLNEYKRLNKEIEVSNIHLKELKLKPNEPTQSIKIKKQINENSDKLRAMEKYSLSSNDSAYPIWIGSLAVFGIFTIHNFFGLFTDVYHTMPILIYGSYVFIIVYAFYFYKKSIKNHDQKNQEYNKILNQTKQLVNEGLKKGYFTKDEIFE